MRHELILGGQKSRKSRCAERRSGAWLATRPEPEALPLATALAGDDDMRQRISRHRTDRAQRVPALATLETPLALAQAIESHIAPGLLQLVDCLTLWLTNQCMPLARQALDEGQQAAARRAPRRALYAAPGPVLLVSNEIGLGVAPMSAEARRFVDELGLLHQAVAALCARVTQMVAGIECTVKGAPA